MALGRDSCLWLPNLQTVMVNNRTQGQGRWHFLILEISVPRESRFYLGNSGSQQLPENRNAFFFFIFIILAFFWGETWWWGVPLPSTPNSPALCRQEPSSLAAGAKVVVCKRDSTICAIRLFPNKPGSCKPYQLWLIVKGRGEKKKAAWACRLQTGRLWGKQEKAIN